MAPAVGFECGHLVELFFFPEVKCLWSFRNLKAQLSNQSCLQSCSENASGRLNVWNDLGWTISGDRRKRMTGRSWEDLFHVHPMFGMINSDGLVLSMD